MPDPTRPPNFTCDYFEAEIAAFKDDVATFILGPFALPDVDQSLSETTVKIDEAVAESHPNVALSRLNDARASAFLGALAAALQERSSTDPTSEGNYICECVVKEARRYENDNVADQERRVRSVLSSVNMRSPGNDFISIVAGCISWSAALLDEVSGKTHLLP